MNTHRVGFLYKLIISVFINTLLVLLVMTFIDIELNPTIIAYIVFVSVLYLTLWKLIFKRPSIVIVFIFTVPIITIYLYKFHHELYFEMITKAADFINWSIRYINGMTFLYKNYLYPFIGCIVLILSIIIYVLVFKTSKTYPLVVLGTIIFLYRWFLFEDKALIYYIFYIASVLQLYTYRVYIEKLENWINNKINFDSNISRRWTIISSIILIVIISLSIISPKNFKPITWRWLDEKVQDSFPQLINWRNTKKTSAGYGSIMKFDLSQTQYQDNYRRLGGPVNQEKVLLMKVISEKPLYLRGRVKDFYTGSYWKSTKDLYYKQLTNSDINLIDRENIEGETIYQRIQHVNLSTSTIFASYIPIRVSHKAHWFYSNDEFELFIGKLLLKEDSYKVYSVKRYIDEDIINNSKYRFREEHEKYLQIPDTLPERVINLSKDITKNIHSDYGKIQTLINYLKSNYKYSLTPKETPHNRDFVDYFLFDERKGYCTYYASSLAIMARCIGIPSRYVEGFVTPQNKTKGEYYIYSDNAHAWTEVFIEGHGWMAFEATPGYENSTYTQDTDITDNQNNGDLEGDNSTVEYNGGSREQNNRLSRLEMLDENFVLNRNLVDEKTKEYKYLYNYAIIVLVFVLLFILMRVLYNIIKIRTLIAQSKDEKNKKLVLNYYMWIMNLLNEINKGKLTHETTIEYSNRIKKEIGFPIEDFNHITTIFNKAFYGDKEITSKELGKLKDCLSKCEKLVLNKIGLLKFIYLKYIAMKFIKNT